MQQASPLLDFLVLVYFSLICTIYLWLGKYMLPKLGLRLFLVCCKTLRVLYVTNFLSYALNLGSPKLNL